MYIQDWLKDEAPEQDGEGFYNTSMPVIIFKMIEQNVSILIHSMSLCMRKPTICASDQVRHKPACTSTEEAQKMAGGWKLWI